MRNSCGAPSTVPEKGNEQSHCGSSSVPTFSTELVPSEPSPITSWPSLGSTTNEAPDSSPAVHGPSASRPAQPLHVPSSLRIASLKLSVSPSPTPPELPATATPTMSLETTGIVVGGAVDAGAVGGAAAVVPGVVGGAVTAVVVGCAVCVGAGVEAVMTIVVVASCDVTSRVQAAGTNASTTIPNTRRVLM